MKGDAACESVPKMLSTLLSDPMLAMLEPIDLVRLRQISKEARDVVETHRKTQSHYTVREKPSVPWKQHLKLYSLYPSVKHLTLELAGLDLLGVYLRPTLQSLHLKIPLQIERRKDYNEWYLRNTWDFEHAFHTLRDYLDSHPEAQLTSFQMSFQPKVTFILEDGGETIVDYDRDGPIYEGFDVWVETDKVKPSEALWLVETLNHSLREASEDLQALAAKRKWKSFVVPEELPGASSCPGSLPCDMDECESMEEYIYSLFHENLKRYPDGEGRYSDTF